VGQLPRPSNFHTRYQWAWARMDNGDLMTYRQWHTADSQDKGKGQGAGTLSIRHESYGSSGPHTQTCVVAVGAPLCHPQETTQ
jgi:hypothetical protein